MARPHRGSVTHMQLQKTSTNFTVPSPKRMERQRWKAKGMCKPHYKAEPQVHIQEMHARASAHGLIFSLQAFVKQTHLSLQGAPLSEQAKCHPQMRTKRHTHIHTQLSDVLRPQYYGIWFCLGSSDYASATIQQHATIWWERRQMLFCNIMVHFIGAKSNQQMPQKHASCSQIPEP